MSYCRTLAPLVLLASYCYAQNSVGGSIGQPSSGGGSGAPATAGIACSNGSAFSTTSCTQATSLTTNWLTYSFTMQYGAATGSSSMFTVTDTANNTGTGYVATFGTASGSSANPFRVECLGVQCASINSSGTFSVGSVFRASSAGTVTMAGQAVAAKRITGNYTATANDVYINCDTTGAGTGGIILTLDTPQNGEWKQIENTASIHSCTINAAENTGFMLAGASSDSLALPGASVGFDMRFDAGLAGVSGCGAFLGCWVVTNQ